MSNRTRNKRIEIYFNEEELEKLDKDSKQIGLTRSEYIRGLIKANVVNKNNNKEILNSILEIQNMKNKLEQLNTKLEQENLYDFELIIKTILNESIQIINKLKLKLD